MLWYFNSIIVVITIIEKKRRSRENGAHKNCRSVTVADSPLDRKIWGSLSLEFDGDVRYIIGSALSTHMATPINILQEQMSSMAYPDKSCRAAARLVEYGDRSSSFFVWVLPGRDQKCILC